MQSPTTLDTRITGQTFEYPIFPKAPEEPNSRLLLFMRYFDSSSNEWSPWAEPDEDKLHSRFGSTPEQWKINCEGWILMGGKYEFKIVRRTDVTEWVTSYKK